MKKEVEAFFDENIKTLHDLHQFLMEVKTNILFCEIHERDEEGNELSPMSEQFFLLAISDVEKAVSELVLSEKYLQQGM